MDTQTLVIIINMIMGVLTLLSQVVLHIRWESKCACSGREWCLCKATPTRTPPHTPDIEMGSSPEI